MKRILLCLIVACSVFASNAKSWSIVGKALEKDTTMLTQDATNSNTYKYVGKLTTKSFKVFDGTTNYVPMCGLNDPFDQTIGMESQLEESQEGFRVKYVNSNQLYCITVTVGASPQIMVQQVIPFEHLYLIGGPVNTHDPSWSLSDARELEKDPNNPFVFYYRGFLKYNTVGDEPGSIKFLKSKTSWDPAFHPAGTTNVLLNQASKMRQGGDDTKWFIPSDGSGNGYYVLKLNTLDQTIRVEKFERTNAEYPSNIFISGDAMPCGWVNDVPETMSPTAIWEGQYSWTGMLVPGLFKFLKSRGSWGSCYVSTIKDQAIEYGRSYPVVYELDYNSNGGNDFKFRATEATRCTIQLNLDKMQMMVVKENQSSTEKIKQADEVIITANLGKIRVKSSSPFKKTFDVFALDGRKIHSNSFFYDSDISVPKGCYIVKVTDVRGMEKVKKMGL